MENEEYLVLIKAVPIKNKETFKQMLKDIERVFNGGTENGVGNDSDSDFTARLINDNVCINYKNDVSDLFELILPLTKNNEVVTENFYFKFTHGDKLPSYFNVDLCIDDKASIPYGEIPESEWWFNFILYALFNSIQAMAINATKQMVEEPDFTCCVEVRNYKHNVIWYLNISKVAGGYLN